MSYYHFGQFDSGMLLVRTSEEQTIRIDWWKVKGDVLYFHSSDLPDILLIGTCLHL